MRRFTPIAIVGRGCVLPGALDPDALWRTVAAGRVHLQPAREPVTGGRCVEAAGYVEHFASVFRPADHDATAVPLAELDPVFQWPVQAGAQALHEARATVADKARTGIVLGNLSYTTAGLNRFAAETLLRGVGTPPPRATPAWNRFMSGLPAIVAAQALGCGGSAVALDAACASSLYAIKIACDRLQSGAADLMIAGGVNAADVFALQLGFAALQAASPTGRSRPFHREADGLVSSEGAACVALRRLDEAIARGDKIFGVIRGLGLSNDGRGAGLLSPAEGGQVRCLAAAYAAAGLAPDAVSWLECHATGTALGDAVEIRSLARVFGARDASLPVGSLKANLGHLVTASGAAGVLRVLGAMAHAELPATPNAFPLCAGLAHTPLEVLGTARAWEPRAGRWLAGVNGFGFGGCNAHLILERWEGAPERGATVVPGADVPAIADEFAVVALGVRADGVEHAEEFAQLIFDQAAIRPPAGSVELVAKACAFPPKDLAGALGQQLLVLAAAQEAVSQLRLDDPRRVGVYIGMGTEAGAARHCVRERLPALLAAAHATVAPETLAAAGEALSPAVTVGRVIGHMANMPANRLSNQFNFGGPSFTVSAEELSGDRALELASAALGRGEIDAALVGAVDVGRDPAHAAAIAAVLPADDGHAADAAVVLVLKRLADARAAGDTILATLGAAAGPVLRTLENRPGHRWLAPRFGHAHAASGLLHVAAGVLLVSRRAWRAPEKKSWQPLLPDGDRAELAVVNTSFAGPSATVTLRAAPDCATAAPGAVARPEVHTFAAENPAALLAAIEAGDEAGAGSCRLGFVCAPGAADKKRRQAAAWLREGTLHEGRAREGIVFRAAPLGGELAAVFTGAASAYGGMGRELALAWPGLIARSRARSARSEQWCGALLGERDPAAATPFAQLCGSSFGCQLHALFSREVLGLAPAAVLGLSSGETNAMLALGVWSDMDGLLDDIAASGLYERELGGAFDAVRRHWNLPAGEKIEWANWRVLAAPERVRAALVDETRCHLAIINTPGDCVIGGDAAACRRVLARLAGAHAVPLGHDLVVHCPAVTPFAAEWRRLHTRPACELGGVRVYSNFLDRSYATNTENVAEALTGQALTTVDFPRIVRRAYADGARVFLEHGPRNGLSLAIGAILGDRPHAAIALDVFGRAGHEQAALAAVELWCAGVAIDLRHLRAPAAAPAKNPGPMLRLALHLPPVDLATMLTPAVPVAPPARVLAKAPRRAAVVAAEPELVGARQVAAPSRDEITAWHAEIATAHGRFLDRQRAAHATFTGAMTQMQSLLLAPNAPRRAAVSLAPRPAPPPPSAAPATAPEIRFSPRTGPRGPTFTRAQLETLASGKISSVFGPQFEPQDGHRIQVRLPMPPLLLVDRVTGLDAVAGSMELGTIWTETEVVRAHWATHFGRMSLGPFIEAGQADMLLISWLGIDFHNRGARAYRLLASTIELFGPLPETGDTLCYEIVAERHAAQGDTRLFFFRNDCRINGEIRMSVRGGVAGFFTPEELDGSAGLKWDAAAARYAQPARLAAPGAAATAKTSLSAAEVAAYARGDMVTAFGESFYLTQTHVRTPRSTGGQSNLIDRVTHLDFRGGPAGRGSLRAVAAVRADAWFFPVHFLHDPCMPGTLMLEGAIQMMSLYLVALGFATDKDSWRFEPVPRRKYEMKCRGQCTPRSREVVYELFVDEVIAGPVPTLFAHVFCTVDGLGAFLVERVGLQLVPDFPLLDRPELLAAAPDARPVAMVDGVAGDRVSLLHSAWGLPSRAFGPRFAKFDRRERGPPRLPGPPYHFITRVLSVEGPPAQMRVGAKATTVFDLAADDWFFQENGRAVMPLSVVMEAALQPSGWLSAHQLSDPLTDLELIVRNLDGKLTLHRDLTPADREFVVETTLTSVSVIGGMVIEQFRNRCLVAGEEVILVETAMGFFPPDALASQKGVKIEPGESEQVNQAANLALDLTALPARYFSASTARLPAGKLRLIDRVTGFWPQGGKKGRGYLRAERDIRPTDWVFQAHFFQDPVQPGSIGVDSLAQLCQFYLLHTGRHAAFKQPVFTCALTGGDTEWHYRGQVTPHSRLTVIDLEIHDEGRDAAGCWIKGEARLWLGELKLYHVTQIGMRLVEAAAPAVPATATDRAIAPRPPEFERVADYWRALAGGRRTPLHDTMAALVRAFVARVELADPAGFAALHGRPALYLANHQVGVETPLFAWIIGALAHTPVRALAKRELANDWTGIFEQVNRAFLGPNPPLGAIYFDREDRASLPRLLAELRARDGGRLPSLMLHAEGTRAAHANQPVARLSSVFLDFAIEHALPIVPVRFTGGLPLVADGCKREHPVGAGAQVYHVGAAIAPAHLAALPYARRAYHVMRAINALGPAAGEERPAPATAESRRLAARIAALKAQRGLPEFSAMVLAALGALPEPGAETQALLAALADPQKLTPPGLAAQPALALFAKLFAPAAP